MYRLQTKASLMLIAVTDTHICLSFNFTFCRLDYISDMDIEGMLSCKKFIIIIFIKYLVNSLQAPIIGVKQ